MPILHWLNDEEARKTSSQLPYRLLEAEPKNSFGDSDSENMLIQGDNLEALKALLPYYAGQVKCIYIDPPYNTQSAFEHYDDNLEHSTWLSTMYPRLEMLRELLTPDGSLWISVDDNEAHYLKIIGDEIFGRGNFLASVVWQKRTSPEARLPLGAAHDYILVFAKNLEATKKKINRVGLSEARTKEYKNPDNDPRGVWASRDITGQVGHATESQFYEITTPAGKKFPPPEGRCWTVSETTYKKLVEDNRIWFGSNGNSRPRMKLFLSESQGATAWTWWTNSEVGHNQESKKEILDLFGSNDVFDTPKPERLIQRVIQLATNSDDIVLDSFLGSGTTAAVAHKMGRRYIGIEMGDHAFTHCAPRLKKVVEGEQGGISKDVNWQGGGGFSFYHLGEPIFDEQGHINAKVKFKSLAAHVWFAETHTPLTPSPSPVGRGESSPLLGVHNETAYYLLYNGILGDKTPEGGNVLTTRVLRELPKHKGKKIIYGEMSMLDETILQKQEITFKHIPYDIKAR
ncbi:MAG: site-specific DNA-methyltransferase [Caldilineales bacterium]